MKKRRSRVCQAVLAAALLALLLPGMSAVRADAALRLYFPLVAAQPDPEPTATRTAVPTRTATPTPPPGPSIAGCPVFPNEHIWNTRVDSLPVDASSSAYVNTIGRDTGFHADFGSGTWKGGPIGIPFVVVPTGQPGVNVSFYYSGESDPAPYPIPTNAPIEGGPEAGGDRHVLVLQSGACRLYETYDSWPTAVGSWHAGSGAVYDLRGYALRPDGWTSADAAGLPILPGLVRYEEILEGEILHAIRFTAPQTRRAYVWPARHFASSLTGAQYPPMGQRFRLKVDYDISAYSPEVQIILTAMKRYGIILADNGAPWYLSGAPDPRWDNDHLHELDDLRGSDFEAVDSSPLLLNASSGQAARLP